MAAKNAIELAATREKMRSDAKTADGVAKRYVLQAIRQLERQDEARKQREEPEKPADQERVQEVARAAARLAEYNTYVAVVARRPDTTGSVYPDWLIKARCLGADDDPRKEFFAVFKYTEAHKPTVAANLKSGMRLHLNLEPFDGQPEDIRRLPIADDFNDFSLPVYWVTSFTHDEPLLKAEPPSPINQLLASIPPGIVLKSPIEVLIGDLKTPFYFFGVNYAPETAPQLLSDHRGQARHSIVSIHRALKQRGIRLIFAPIPLSVAVFSDLALGKDEGMSLAGPIANGGTAEMLAALQKDGVDVLDLTKTMRRQRYIEHEGSQYPVSQPNGLHLAGPGCRVIAAELANAVNAFSTFPTRRNTSGPLFAIDSQVVRHPGDLQEIPALKFMGIRLPSIPMLIQHVEPLSEVARTMLATDSSQSEIHLVGDSQCGIYSKEHAGIHAHLVRELEQSVNLVPVANGGKNAAMDKWLRSENLAKAKIVFWLVSEPYLGETGWIDPSDHPALMTPSSGEPGK